MSPREPIERSVQCGELEPLALLAQRDLIRRIGEWDDCGQRLLFDPRFPFAPTCEFERRDEALQRLAGEAPRGRTRVALGSEEAEPGR